MADIEYTLLNAKEAHEASSRKLYELSENEIKEISDLINQSIDNGDFRVTVHKKLISATAQTLEDYGYEVRAQSSFDGIVTTISW